MTEEVPIAPPVQKVPIEDVWKKSNCTIIFFKSSTKKDRAYCIIPQDVKIVNNSDDKKNEEKYILPIPNIYIDRVSYLQLLKGNAKAYVAIKKSDIYILKPLYIFGEGKESEAQHVYENPVKFPEGAFGKVTAYPTEKIVHKISKKPGLPPDIVKEISIYSYFYKISCIPTMIDFNVKNDISIKLELGKSCLFDVKNELTYIQKKIIYLRIFKCLMIIASQGIIHGDIKAENFIISENGSVKIIDWGSAKIDTSKGQTMLKPVGGGTPGYYAPEILGKKESHYTYKIDIYSMAVMIHALHTGYVIDQCFKNYSLKETKMLLMARLLGRDWDEKKVDEDFSDLVKGPSVADEIKRRFLEPEYDKYNQPHMGRVFSENLADLMSKMFEFNPKHRISYDKIIIHPYFQNIHRERVGKLPIFINDIQNIRTIDKNIREPMLKNIKDHLISLECDPSTFAYAIQIFDEYSSKYNMVDLPSIIHDIASASLYLAICLTDFHEEAPEKMMNDAKKILTRLRGNLLKPTFYSYYVRIFGEKNLTGTVFDDLFDIYCEPLVYKIPMRDFMMFIVKTNKYPSFQK